MGSSDSVGDDPIKTFMDLAYPGKKVPVQRRPPTQVGGPAPLESEPWDANPVVYVFNGQSREFYTIGHLSKAINRQPVTIRAWENRGVLPKSRYRSPKPTWSVQGEPKGRRLWTHEQIAGIVRIAQEVGVIFNGKPPSKEFTVRVAQLYRDIYEQEDKVRKIHG